MICNHCHRRKKGKEKFNSWIDYTDHKVYYFCGACWVKARAARRHGLTFRAGLFEGNTKVGVLRAKTIGKFERKNRAELKKKIGMCQRCGAHSEDLQVHHYRWKSQGGLDQDDNYLILCPECHKAYHAKSTGL